MGGADGKIYLDPQTPPPPPQLPSVLYLSLSVQLPGWRLRHPTGGGGGVGVSGGGGGGRFGGKGLSNGGRELERRGGRAGTVDPAAFLAGLAMLLRQLPEACWQV